mmetsp:Transcript_34057/g.33247  ORF Transcript_34057/g.33247 Transcript_34057/m.33247 type:complete len:129 (-) Transcript_34057:1718-2104(-)
MNQTHTGAMKNHFKVAGFLQNTGGIISHLMPIKEEDLVRGKSQQKPRQPAPLEKRPISEEKGDSLRQTITSVNQGNKVNQALFNFRRSSQAMSTNTGPTNNAKVSSVPPEKAFSSNFLNTERGSTVQP